MAISVDKSTLDLTRLPRTSKCFTEVSSLLGAAAVGDETVRMASGSTLSTTPVTSGDFERTLCPTPLHQACFDGRLDLVQMMFSSHTVTDGFDTDPVNCQGQTPLLLAVLSGNVDLVTYLIEIGCDVHHSDFSDNNALHLAAAARVRFFVQHHGYTGVCQVEEHHSPPSVEEEQRTMVELLVSCGVSVRQRNRHGFTPIRLAALMGSEECARRMLKRFFSGSRQFDQSDVAVLPELNGQGLSCDRTDSSESDNSRRRHLVTSLRRLIVGPSGAHSSESSICRTSRDVNRSVRPSSTSSTDHLSQLLGVTPLYAATTAGDYLAARLLLDVCRADPDRGCDGLSNSPSGLVMSCRGRRLIELPLGVAVLRNDTTLARLLLDRGASACCRCLEDHRRGRRHSDIDTWTTTITTTSNETEDDCDLLELALYTDWPVSQLLVAGGACLTLGVERFLTNASQSIRLDNFSSSSIAAFVKTVKLICEANGNCDATRRMMSAAAAAVAAAEVGRLPLVEPLVEGTRTRTGADCDSLLQLSRLTIRRVVAPRVFWAVRHLPLPDVLKRFIAIE